MNDMKADSYMMCTLGDPVDVPKHIGLHELERSKMVRTK